MNTVVVYDSQFGNTQRIAQAIADTLRAFGQAQAIRSSRPHALQLQRSRWHHATEFLAPKTGKNDGEVLALPH